MTELIDSVELSSHQTVDVHEDGTIWLHDNRTAQDIELDAGAGTVLFDFLLRYQERLIRWRDQREGPPSDQPFFSSYLLPGRPTDKGKE